MTNQEVVRECARYRRRAIDAERRAEALDAELVLVRGERDTEKARADAYEKAVVEHNKKMDAIPSWITPPRKPAEGLRFLAFWLDALYGDAGTGKDAVQADLRRWATQLDADERKRGDDVALMQKALKALADASHLPWVRLFGSNVEEIAFACKLAHDALRTRLGEENPPTPLEKP